MAPTDKKIKHKTFEGKDGNQNRPKTIRSGVKMKRKWVPENKQFEGSVKEGMPFRNAHSVCIFNIMPHTHQLLFKVVMQY